MTLMDRLGITFTLTFSGYCFAKSIEFIVQNNAILTAFYVALTIIEIVMGYKMLKDECE